MSHRSKDKIRVHKSKLWKRWYVTSPYGYVFGSFGTWEEAIEVADTATEVTTAEWKVWEMQGVRADGVCRSAYAKFLNRVFMHLE